MKSSGLLEEAAHQGEAALKIPPRSVISVIATGVFKRYFRSLPFAFFLMVPGRRAARDA